MTITRLAISGYRSLRDITLELGPLNVVTGSNGSGKSSLYRALHLLADIAQGRIVQSLAAEGGLQSTLWAGPETISRSMKAGVQAIEGTIRKKPIALKLGFSGDDYGYAIDLGVPKLDHTTMFSHDPEIKVEAIWSGQSLSRTNAFAERRGMGVRLRSETGEWRSASTNLAPFDSMMTHYNDWRDAPEILTIRERMRAWRFYDQLRTDRDSLARRPQIGTYTPVMADDGADLAAAVRTIMEIGNPSLFDSAIADAFPGSNVSIENVDGYFELRMQQHGLLRSLKTSELSDGTLRYIFLTTALLTPRSPELMILNEPESSLHPDLLSPLARLIAQASERSQIVVVSHSQTLVTALEEEAACRIILLEKEFGETIVSQGGAAGWVWPSR